MASLDIASITKIYDDAQGTETAVESLSVAVEDGEFIVFVGPSGCGKSTTLRMLAGLETVTDGVIEIGNREVQHLAPSERSVAMVFQSYALYSQMSARENMGYGLKHAGGLPKAERQSKVEDIAELLGIEELLDSSPNEMSGGQKQRVALGRAIVRDPDVFLLDEPLSNLDAKLRAHMRTELQRIQEEFGVTTVYVTHDQTEAMTMADRIAVMNDGILQQVAPPEEAYDHPVNEFVATFLGSPAMNVLDAEVNVQQDEIQFRRSGSTFATVPSTATSLKGGSEVRVGLRPEDLHIGDGPGTFRATVSVTEYQGNDNFVHLSAGGEILTARVPPTVYPESGDTVHVTVDPTDVFVFDRATGESLKTRGLPDSPNQESELSSN